MALPVELRFIIDMLALFSIYLIIVISLNLEFGYGGIPNFGKVLTVAGGAFVAGYVPGRLAAYIMGIGQDLDYIRNNAQIINQVNIGLKSNIPIAILIFIITLTMAAFVGGALGFLASYPAIRLREDYLATTLLAVGEIMRLVGNNYPPLVGGTLGVQVPDPFAFVGGELRFTVATIVIIIIAVLVFLYAELLVRSPLGRVLRAIRDSEVAAASLGKDVVRNRMKLLVVGSAIGAIGGAIYAFYSSAVVASGYDRLEWTYWPWVMVMLGGAANNTGSALGAFTFVFVRRIIIFFKSGLAPFLPFDVVWLDLLLLGFVLLIILMYRPEGILPEKPTSTIERKKLEEFMSKGKSQPPSEKGQKESGKEK